MQATRRGLMLGAAASLSVAGKARAQASDARFVVIVLRGAMDGLDVVVPYGDPDLKTHRASLLLPEPGNDQGLRDLGGFFGLHPSLKATHALFEANDVLPIQAIAGWNRSRSHFEAQDMLEIGAPTRLTSGWLNRIAALMPENPNCDMAFNVGSSSPLILHGPTPVASWDPFHPRPRVSPGFYETIAAMQGTDAKAEVTDGLRERQYIDKVVRTVSYDGIEPGFPRLARAAAALLVQPDGPRLAELELDGWDTHSSQPPRLARSLATLDNGIAVLRAGLAPVWSKTAILVITEFGRTVRVNGTLGTDHGTGTAAFLIGGAIAGGKVRSDWPGLKPSQLFEDRDLQQTLDIRAVAKGVLGPHFGIAPAQLETIFPDSRDIAPATGLLRV